MKLVPFVLGAALLVLVAAFGLHCLVLRCDHSKTKSAGTKGAPR